MSELSPTGISIIVAAAAVGLWLLLRLRRGGPGTDVRHGATVEEDANLPSSGSKAAAATPTRIDGPRNPDGNVPAAAEEIELSHSDTDDTPAEPAGNVSVPALPTVADQQAIRQGLKSTRAGFMGRLSTLLRRRPVVDEELINQLEETLLSADVGVATARRLLDVIQKHSTTGGNDPQASLWAALREEVRHILSVPSAPIALGGSPSLILVAGVNGVGKTTTIGKLASRYSAEGKRVLLAAGDTYRAAAVLQLEVWGKRVNCPVVKGKEGADPGSVIFDAVSRARQEGYDLVLADTAGRLHTQQPLMEELKKVNRTVIKALGGKSADEILLVLDATTGQNAVQQMHMFREALAISGVVLTKLDGTAKGGVVLGIVDEHKVPVRFVGLGERVEDLRAFDVESFVSALFEEPEEDTVSTQSA